MEILLELSIAMMVGLLVSRVTKLLKLPAVTAYLIAGIIVGPYILGNLGIPGIGFHNLDEIKGVGIICDVALGFIAFSMGSEFRVKELKAIGKQAFFIGVFQAFVAAILVDIALIALHFAVPEKISLSAAITLGAIATATAPAATLMVVRQYKAKGPLTNILLPVVALDDAVGLVVFAISFGIARALQGSDINIVKIILEPIIEVVASLILGAIMGVILTCLRKLFESNTRRLCMMITFVMATVGLSMITFNIGTIHVSFSSLLVCMMLGTIFCNLCEDSPELMAKSERWTAPLYVLFFVLSGAELELGVFGDWAIVGIGVLFIIVRSIGKYVGAFASAKIMKCDEKIVKYLGITLLPQAGVALGMCIKAEALGGVDATIVRNIILFAVLIYEIVGPYLTKKSLMAAGEISSKKEYMDSKKAKAAEQK